MEAAGNLATSKLRDRKASLVAGKFVIKKGTTGTAFALNEIERIIADCPTGVM